MAKKPQPSSILPSFIQDTSKLENRIRELEAQVNDLEIRLLALGTQSKSLEQACVDAQLARSVAEDEASALRCQLLPISQSPKVFFVSGHLDVSQDEFFQLYVPKILGALSSPTGARFLVGDAPGCDERTQRLFKDAGLLSLLTVYHMKERPRIYVGEPAGVQGGFRNDDDRDTAMTKASTEDIAWVRQGREKSGTARNLSRRSKSGLVSK